MFNKRGFAPVAVVGPPDFPRIFSYCNKEDLLSEIMEPGYFEKSRILLRPNSFIKVICKDAIAEIVVKENAPEVTFWDEILMATDPYKVIKTGARGGHNKGRKKAVRRKTKVAQTEEQKIAMTG